MEAAAVANELIALKYSKEKKVGEGTYAVVYLGKELATGRDIAIKKIKVGQFKDGLDISAIREVKFLRELAHPNVIELLDVFSQKTNLNLVLEFLPTDLEGLIRDRSLVFKAEDIKSWMLMILKGLEFCHRNWILHRDMKPNNLLIAPDGTLKIADFGLAREFADEGVKMTSQVVTRWYRPPELLFNARSYSTGVDNWATGCIFAELMLRVPYLAGENDLEQLTTIFRALGTPTEEDWNGINALSEGMNFVKIPKSDLKGLFTAASVETLDLLSKLLMFDPRKRMTALQALHHPYFQVLPQPTPPPKLPRTNIQLAPRPLDPNDPNNHTDTQKKRKSEGFEEEGRTKVARKLNFGA